MVIAYDQLPESDESTQGSWIYDGQEHTFLLDKFVASLFGLDADKQECFSEDLLLQCLSDANQERFYRAMYTRETGNIIFEDFNLIAGPHKGESFVVQGSVLTRFADGKVRYATGSMSSALYSYADFLSHEMAGDCFFSYAPQSNRLRFSDSYTFLLGYDRGEMPRTIEGLHKLVHTDDREIFDVEQHIINSDNYGDSYEFCVRLRHKNGNYTWFMGRESVLSRNYEGQALRLIGSLSDINLIQNNFDSIKQLLYTDTLTGLKNRSYFQNHVTAWHDPAMRPLSVIYADVTGLKITNDVLGHADGDLLLLTVTEALTTVITRPCDIMRLAGDEFLVIIPHCTSEEVNTILEQIRNYLQQYNSTPDVMPVFAGLGCSSFDEDPHDTLNACIGRADVRMQADKDANRKDSYTRLKAYLEKRMGRPVSMRDGRRLSYMNDEERQQHRESVEHAEGAEQGNA